MRSIIIFIFIFVNTHPSFGIEVSRPSSRKRSIQPKTKAPKSVIRSKRNKRGLSESASGSSSEFAPVIPRYGTPSEKLQHCINNFITQKNYNIPLLDFNNRYNRNSWPNPYRNVSNVSSLRIRNECQRRINTIIQVEEDYLSKTRLTLGSALNLTGHERHFAIINDLGLGGVTDTKGWNILKEGILFAYFYNRSDNEFPNASAMISEFTGCIDQQLAAYSLTRSRFRNIISQNPSSQKIYDAAISGVRSLNFRPSDFCREEGGEYDFVGRVLSASDLVNLSSQREIEGQSFDEVNFDEFGVQLIGAEDGAQNLCQDLFRVTLIRDPEEAIKRSIKRYIKCYQQFTSMRVPANDERIERINNGEINGTEACMDLLDSASLSGDVNAEEWRLISNTNESQSVLKTFNDLHRSWFTNIEFPADNNSFATEDLLDSGEGAYYFTRSLFSEQVTFQDVLTGDIVLGGLRQTDHTDWNHDDHFGHLQYYLNPDRNAQNLRTQRVFNEEKGYSFGRDVLNTNGYISSFNSQNKWKSGAREHINDGAPIVPTGMLIGITNRSAQYAPSELRNFCGLFSATNQEWVENGYGGFEEIVSYTPFPNNDDAPPQQINATAVGKGFNEKIGQTSPVDLFRSAGGGAMGSHAFILQNMDNTFPKVNSKNEPSARGHRAVADGSLKLQRRWAKRVISDFLCRDVPVIEHADAAPFQNEDSSLPFRNDISCMQCHATIDRMAMAARNIVIEKTGSPAKTRTQDPILRPSLDDFCAPEQENTISRFRDGEWQYITNDNIDIKRTTTITAYEGVEVSDRNLRHRQAVCLPKVYSGISEEVRKAYWPSRADRWQDKDLCNNGGEINSFVHEDYTDLEEEANLSWNDVGEVLAKPYHLTKPAGVFYYREAKNRVNLEENPEDEAPPITNEEVVGVEDLASKIRNTQDFFSCGAKRYLRFLTGINAFMEFKASNLNRTQKNYQNILNCLSADLRSTNNPKETIRKIIASDFYLNPFILDEEITDLDRELMRSRDITYDTVKSHLASCTDCHGGEDLWNNSDYLTTANQFKVRYGDDSDYIDSQHYGEPMVIPGDPCGSRLLFKLTDYKTSLENLPGELDNCSDSVEIGNMPQNMPPLGSEAIKDIYFWILNLEETDSAAEENSSDEDPSPEGDVADGAVVVAGDGTGDDAQRARERAERDRREREGDRFVQAEEDLENSPAITFDQFKLILSNDRYKCLACHDFGDWNQDDFTTPQQWPGHDGQEPYGDEDIPLIVAGDPCQSLIYTRLNGNDCNEARNSMPYDYGGGAGAVNLSPEDLRKIRSFIENLEN